MISIIVPVYNVEQYLAKCLDSCFAQTYQDIEVIAVNDGSTDGCAEILDQYAEKESRLRVIHTGNGGVAKARSVGIDASCGEWLMFVDSDDYITNNAVEILLNETYKAENIDIVLASMNLLWSDGSIRSITQSEGFYKSEEYFSALLCSKIIWGPVCKLFKSSLFEDNFNIPPHIKIGEDLMLNLLIATKVNTVTVINTPIYYYRKLAQSTVFNMVYGIDYWRSYIDLLIVNLRHNKVYLAIFRELLGRFMLNMSFNIISSGKKINDIEWRNLALKGVSKTKRLTRKEQLTIFLLKYTSIQPIYCWIYKKIKLRKL